MEKMVKDKFLYDVDNMEKMRRLHESILNDNEKIKEFINEYPFIFSIIFHSFEIKEFAITESCIIPLSNAEAWYGNKSFIYVAIDLFIKNLTDRTNTLTFVEERRFYRIYEDNIYDGKVKKEISKMVNNRIMTTLYDEYNDEVDCFILYPLDEIIKKCLEEQELHNYVCKIKKKTILNFALHQ